MSELISVGRLAITVGVSTRTIRYYEEMDILTPAIVTESNYRLYGDEELKKLKLILLMKSLGLSLHEIKLVFQNQNVMFKLFSDKKTILESEIAKLSSLAEFLSSFLNITSCSGQNDRNPLELLSKLYLSKGDDLAMRNYSIFPIRVIALGCGCNNVINSMIEAGVNLDFISINTDKQSLATSKAPQKILIGENLTRTLGAGGNSEVGVQSTLDKEDEIKQSIKGTDMLFIVTCLGGGTGTGAAPIVAKIAREQGVLTIGIVTKPSVFEGKSKLSSALDGIEKLKENVDLLLVIPNDIALKEVENDFSSYETFKIIDDYIAHGVKSISDLVTSTVSSLDFEDIKFMIREKGLAYMGIGKASEGNRVDKAVNLAINSPHIKSGLGKAKGIIVNISGGLDITQNEVHNAIESIQKLIDPNANMIFGTVINEKLEGSILITIIITGCNIT